MSIVASTDPTQYFAAELDSERCAANIVEKIRRYRRWLKDTGAAQRMVRSFRAYYGYAPDGMGDTSITSQGGEQGELVDVTTNDYATLVTQTTVLTVQNKPGLHAIATNADFDSMAQTEFAQGLLDFYDRKHSVQDRNFETVQIGYIAREGWQIRSWDATAGKSLTDFVDGPALNEGDLQVGAYTPFRVAYDPDAENVEDLQWIAFKRRLNRFDLAAKLKDANPEAAQALLETADDPATLFDDTEADGFDLQRNTAAIRGDGTRDRVWVWEFRHLPSPSLPNGRLVLFVSPECVLFDSISQDVETGEVKDAGYPYSGLHAERFSPDTTLGSIAGHTPCFDLLGLQELVDTIATQMGTAASAGGIQNLWTREGDKLRVDQTPGAMNFLQSATKPERVEGVTIDPQLAHIEEFVMKRMMRRLGQSDVSMGDVPKGMPGNLAALLEAKTVQYHSRGQASYAQMIERGATSTLKILQTFANSERVAVIGGSANEWQHKAWQAKDISGIDRFVVESISPLSQSYAGKLEAADNMLGRGMFDANPKGYLLVRETGRMEPLTEAPESNQMRVRKEKELLRKGIGLPPVDPRASFEASAKAGKPVPVFMDPPAGPDGKAPQCIRPFIYDKHWEDIPEYLAVADMPMARDRPDLVAAVTGLVEEKVRLMKLIDPVMLAVLKCPPEVAQAIAMAQMPPPMPMGGPSDGTQPPAPGGKSATQPPAPGLPAGAPPIAPPRPAKPPRNPLTGQQDPSPVNGVQ